jgi:branched-chain amino acid transport system substrate-binding protein
MNKKMFAIIHSRLNVLICLCCFSMSGCHEAAQKTSGDSIKIGLLLSFTGSLAASGRNSERALIWVAEQVNASGGVANRQVELITCDSNSSIERGLLCMDKFLSEGVIAIIGPEFEDLMEQMIPITNQHEVIQISSGATSPIFTALDTKGYWFRTFPSALSLGNVLASQIWGDGGRDVVILYVDDVFGRGLSDMVQREFKAMGGAVLSAHALDPSERHFRATLSDVAAAAPDAVVLIAYPQMGAAVVNEAAAIGGRWSWHLSHTLYSDVFARNVAPGITNRMVGVTPAVPMTDVGPFSTDFSGRWPGEAPLVTTYFVYDALAVLLLAIEDAAQSANTGQLPSAAEISSHLRSVSANSSGRKVAWYELAHGLELVREKSAINYRGVSGSVDFDTNGEVPPGLVQLWSVQNNRIEEGEVILAAPLSQ